MLGAESFVALGIAIRRTGHSGSVAIGHNI